MKCQCCGDETDNGHDREYPPNAYNCSLCVKAAERLKIYEDAKEWMDEQRKKRDTGKL